jgi:hypothetical protein
MASFRLEQVLKGLWAAFLTAKTAAVNLCGLSAFTVYRGGDKESARGGRPGAGPKAIGF